MYTINSNVPHPSIQSGHGFSSRHALAPGGLADRDDPYYQAHQSIRVHKNVAFKDVPTRIQGKIISKLCREQDIAAPNAIKNLAKFLCCLLKKQETKGESTIRITHQRMSDELEISIKSSHRHWKGIKQTGFFHIETIHDEFYGTQLEVSFSEKATIIQYWNIKNNKKSCQYSKGGVLDKMTNTPPFLPYIERARLNISKSNQKDFYLCSTNDTKYDKIISDMKEKHDVLVIEGTTSSATPEKPQNRIALKSKKAKENIDPRSETLTKPTERKDVKKEKPTPSLKLQASSSPQMDRAEEELNAIAEEAYEEFLVLYKPEEDKRFAVYKTDFIRMVKARTKSHLGCAKDIKTYMRKFSINQYLMGKRIGKNGQFFNPSLYGLFSPTIIDDYHKGEYSRYFTPYNELDLSKKTEAKEGQDATVPQELLQKISLALLGANEQTEVDPEQTQDILKIIRSYAVQKMENQKPMTQTPERKPNELNPLPVLRSSSGDQATISVANQERSWLKKGESYWQTLDITCRKQWEDAFIATIRRGETGFRVDQDIHDPMFRKFKTVPFMTWIGKILEQEERQENNISPETEIEEIDAIIPDLEEPEDVEFEDFPKEELEQSDSEELWVTHFQNKSASYGQNVRRTLHTLLLFASLWQSAQAVEIKSCFTPQQQCLPLIVTELQNPQSEILMQAYSLTSKPISKALRDAHDRGVKVRPLTGKKFSFSGWFVEAIWVGRDGG